MFGSPYVKFIHGNWHHYSLTTGELAIPSGVTLTKGTWCAERGTSGAAVLASGAGAVGFMTQDVNAEGQTSLQSYKDRTIGKLDLPMAAGADKAVTLRVPDANAVMEFEGDGTAIPGNLVCTSGTGALSSSTAAKTPLSFFNGAIRIAQSGDVAQLILLDASLTPEISGNTRIRVQAVGAFIKA